MKSHELSHTACDGAESSGTAFAIAESKQLEDIDIDATVLLLPCCRILQTCNIVWPFLADTDPARHHRALFSRVKIPC